MEKAASRLGRNPFGPARTKPDFVYPQLPAGPWKDAWGRVDEPFMRKLEPLLDALWSLYFRCDISGWEHVPPKKKGPVIFVGNHNGILTFEVLMLFHAWRKHAGQDRPVLGLAHDIAFDNPIFSWITKPMGTIPADPAVAREALRRGFDLMVFPGGEKESFRPFVERDRVDFFQRKGFIKLALESGATFVPVASIGAHESYMILDRGEELAESLGLKDKFKLHGVPITPSSIFFMWCLTAGLVTFFPLLLAPAAFASIFVPMPAKMSFRVLEPVDARALALAAGDPLGQRPETLQMLYDRVVGALQASVTEVYATRKYPVVG